MIFGKKDKKEKENKMRSLHSVDTDETLPEELKSSSSKNESNGFYAKQTEKSKELEKKIEEKEEHDEKKEGTAQKHSLFYGKYDTFKTKVAGPGWYNKFTIIDKIILGGELLMIFYGILILIGLLPLF